jgi:hypothetical protein
MDEQKLDNILILGWERGGRARRVNMRTRKDPCLVTTFMPKNYKLLVERVDTGRRGGPASADERANLEGGPPST